MFSTRSNKLTILSLILLAGCKAKPAISDAALSANIQSQFNGDSALAGQQLQANVAGAVATLQGMVANDAQRTLAARDAASVAGVKEVVNNIAIMPVQPPSQTAVTAPPAPLPVPIVAAPKLVPAYRAPVNREAVKSTPPVMQKPYGSDAQRSPAPIERPQETYVPPPPAAPVRPSFHNVTLAAGATLPVRVTQTLDSATTQPGDTFSGVLSSDVLVDGLVALPAGSPVSGRVDAVQEAAHFKGSSLLTVSLTGVTRRGERIAISSDPFSVKGKGRGANTAERTGGGAAVGAILGGIFGGGKGAAIGAGAGAGVGAGSSAVTRGQQVQIESESIVRFQTTAPITVRVRNDGGAPQNDSGGLNPR